MSRTVDERVVSMEFDNKRFESNVQTSLSTIEKLKQSLKFKGVSDSLSDINKSVKKTDLSPLSNAAHTVGLKFSAMYTIADQAFRNITNSAMAAGKRIASAITIDPVKTGMNEYELKMGSVQTIMASTGESLGTVNRYLEELNAYSDQTIYSFQDMTSNIGKFTNAGVKLEDAVMAIKGISNEAAISGANANEASRAMYNFSQALSAGYVKLIDWKSIENANMATVEFKNQLIATAVELGTVKKASDGMYKTLDGNLFNATKNFNEVLNDQWMTSEVLVGTLKDYADETTDIGKKAKAAATEIKTFSMLTDTLKESLQSGWAQTWELIVGDFEQAKALWSKVGEVLGGIIDKTAKARNELLGEALGSKWDKLTKRINEAGIETSKFEEEVKKVVKTQRRDYDMIIKKYGSLEKAVQAGAISTKTLQTAIGNLSKSMSSADLNIVDKILGKGDKGAQVKEVQQALVDLGYDIGKQFGVDGIIGKYTEEAIKEFQKNAGLEVTGIVDEKTLEALKKATEGAADLGNSIDDILDGIDKLGGRQLLIESFKNIFGGLGQILGTVKDGFRDIFPPMTAEKLYNLIEKFHELTSKFKVSTKTTIRLRKVFRGLFAAVDIVWHVIKSVGKAISAVFGGDLVKKAGGGILAFAGKIGDLIVKFRGWLKENDRLTNAFVKLIQWIQKAIGKVIDWIVSLKDLPFVTKLVDKFKEKWKSLDGATPFDKIATVFKKLGSAIKGAFGKVKDFIKGFKDLPGVQENLDKFKSEFKKIKDTLKGKWSTGLEKIKEFIQRVKEMDGLSFKNIKKAFVDFKDNVLGHFFKKEDGSSIFSGLINAVKNLKNKAKEYLESVGISFDKGKNKIIDFFTGIKDFFVNNKGMIIGIASIVATVVGIIAIAKKVSSIAQTLRKPIDILEDIAETFKDLSGSMQKKMKADAIKSIAIAIGILAVSIFLLTKTDPGKMWSAVGVIVVLAGVLTAMTMLIGKKINPEAIANISKAMLSIGAAMLMMAVVAKILGGMSWGELGKGAAGIAVFLGLMTGMMAASKLIGTKNLNEFGSMMLKLSGALLIMAIVAKILGKMDTGVLIKGGLAITAFLGLMSVMMLMTKVLGPGAVKFGTCMLALSAGLLIMTMTVRILGGMDTEKIVKGGIAITAFMGIVGALMLLTKFMGNGSGDLAKFGVMMMGIAAAMLVMSASVAILGSISTEKLVKGITAVAILGAIVAGFMLLSKFAGSGGNFKSLIGMAAAIAILSVSIIALTLVDTKKMFAATAAISIIMAAFAGVIMSTKMLNTKSMGTLLVMAGMIALIAGIFMLLSKLEVGSVLGIATSLSATLLAVSGACAIMGKVPVAAALKGAVAFGIFVVAVGAIMAGLGLLVSKVEGAQEFITAGLPVLQAIGTGLGSFIGGFVGGMAEGLTSSLPAIGTHLSDFATNLQPFLDTVSGIDAGLLTAVGNLTGALAAITAASILDSITSWITGSSSITSFCEQLVPFGNAMVSFSNTVSGKINEDAITAAANAGSLMAAMADTIPNSGGVVGFFAGENDLDTFAAKLIPFGNAIVSFSSIVSGNVDEAGVQAASNAGQMMTAMADTIPNSGGVLGFFAGENDLDTFAAKLVPFGNAIVSFSSIVAGNVDESAVQAAANAGKMMSEMASTIPNSGGVLGFFAGENDLDTFAAKLPVFGVAIRTFSSQVSGNVDESAIQAAANAGKMMSEMASTIPNSGGVVAFFTGDNDLGTFGAQLVLFGTAMKNFAAEVTGLDTAAVDTAVSAGGALAEMAKTLPESGGLWSVFSADNDLSTFATEIKKFGSGMKGFSESVAGIDVTAVSAATSAATSLATLATNMGSADKLADLSNFGADAESFGKKLSKFSDNIAGIDTVKMTTVVTSISNLANIDLSGLSSLGDSLATIGTTSIDGFLDSFTNADAKFVTAGGNLIGSFIKGISSKLSLLKTAATTIINSVANQLKGNTSAYSSAGGNVVKGFASGIRSNTWRATDAARAMGKATLAAAKSALRIASPSKEFYSVGDFAGQGFVNALYDYESVSYKAGAGMADSARSGLSKAISKVQDILSNDVETQPTIRPVLDLSDIANGAGNINRMLSMNPSVGVMANVGAINTSMGRIQNGYSNDDVVSAIKDLGRKLGNMSGDNYSINGITYDDGSAVSDAVKSIVRAAQIERRR